MPAPAADAVALLTALLACPSVTPKEGGALALLESVLVPAGFAVERTVFSEADEPDVENLFATVGEGGPHLLFGGHTDVVPPGDAAAWTHSPFSGDVADGAVWGRGAVDMKGGIACFVAATMDWLAAGGGKRGRISLLITGDEEGPAVNGTIKMLAKALAAGHRFDAAIVGEPTSVAKVGDMVKIGRRGSMSGTIRVTGKQGHAAYPHLADNPVPKLIRMLHRLTELRLDEGNAEFAPSNLEVVSVDVGNPAFNVIPAVATARINVRFNDHWSSATLKEHIRRELDAAAKGAAWEVTFTKRASEPFITRSGPLIGTIVRAVGDVTGRTPELSTGGGTSDARFFKDACPVAELGLVGATMHQVDERARLADIAELTAVYRRFLDLFFAGPARDV